MKKQNSILIPACVLAAVMAPAAALANGSNAGRGGEVGRLLQEIRGEKRQVADGLETLAGMSRNPFLISWETHSAKLAEVGDRMNRIDERLREIEKLAASNPTVEPAATESLRTRLAPVARGLNEKIRKLQDNRLVVRTPGYYQAMDALAKMSRTQEASLRQWAMSVTRTPAGAVAGGL